MNYIAFLLLFRILNQNLLYNNYNSCIYDKLSDHINEIYNFKSLIISCELIILLNIILINF